MYEQVEDGSSIEGRSHVSDAVEVVQKASRTVRYRHLDRLGSLEAATTEAGAEDTAYEHGYDAFGDPRSRDWQSSGDQMGQTDERGFTGHEHLDNLRLIHMNGRVYDYKLGRFLSVDPIISKPADSQSINPYSYIGNNPLSGVDPSGYCSVVTGGRMCGAQRDDVDATIYGSAPAEGGKAAADRAPPPVQSNGALQFAGGLLIAAHTSPAMKALSDEGSSSNVASPNVNNVDAHREGEQLSLPRIRGHLRCDGGWRSWTEGSDVASRRSTRPRWSSRSGPAAGALARSHASWA